MKVSITIDCDSGKELLAHLSVIRMQAKAAIRKAQKSGIVPKPIKLSDNNCYGAHKAIIRDFGADDLFS